MVDVAKVLLAKKETVYGEWAEPTAAANTVVTRNLQVKPVEVDRIQRNLDSRSYGGQPSAPSNERQTMGFEVELAGSGAAGTAAPWQELLQACGMAPPVLTAATSSVQRMGTPTEPASSLSLANFQSDQRRRGVGARGTFSLDFTAGAYPFAALQLTALLPAAAFEALPPQPGSTARWKQPAEVNNANTTIGLDGFALRLRSLRLDAGVQAGLRALVGARYINRGQHAFTGQAVIEATTYAEKDYLASLRSGKLVPLSVIHGTVPGNVIEVFAPRAQILDATESEEDGKLMWTLPLGLSIDQGADDLVLTVR